MMDSAGWREWVERVDGGARGRAKGARLVAAYGLAILLGWVVGRVSGWGVQGAGVLAAGYALWASVSEDRFTSRESVRDLVWFVGSAVLGSLAYVLLRPVLLGIGHAELELSLVAGAFVACFLRGVGRFWSGVGSQFYIGMLLAYNSGPVVVRVEWIGLAGVVALVAAVAPQFVFRSAKMVEVAEVRSSPVRMGLLAAVPSLLIVLLNRWIGLEESAWAITACTYVVSVSRAATLDRVRRRVMGTVVGVPLGLACLPLAERVPWLLWALAAGAMVIYAMALPVRYDIACAAFAYTLVVTLAASGEHSMVLLGARLWETLLGGTLSLAAVLLFSSREVREGRL